MDLSCKSHGRDHMPTMLPMGEIRTGVSVGSANRHGTNERRLGTAEMEGGSDRTREH